MKNNPIDQEIERFKRGSRLFGHAYIGAGFVGIICIVFFDLPPVEKIFIGLLAIFAIGLGLHRLIVDRKSTK